MTEATDGTVLVRCHAGCSVSEIVAALGLNLRDLFPRAGHQAHHGPPRRVVARFDIRARRDPADFEALVASCERAACAGKLAQLATRLGLTEGSLQALGVGWDASRRAWTFPMRDGRGRLVGIRLRLRNGRKLSIKGSREGLFIPKVPPSGRRLFVAEGPTDTAALLDMGVPAIGRPSCTGAVDQVLRYVQEHLHDEVVIAADHDTPGKQGAERLARVLLPYAPVRVITPPAKDVRAWRLERGATAEDLEHLVLGEPVRQLHMTVVGCRGES